ILRDYYLQVIEDNGGKIPWWVDLVLVEGSVMLPKIQLAKKLRKVNAENARLRAEISQLRGNTPVLNEVPKRERRNWKIDKNGYFEKDEYGNYIPKADRTDKASLNDIEKIAEYNSKKIVQEA